MTVKQWFLTWGQGPRKGSKINLKGCEMINKISYIIFLHKKIMFFLAFLISLRCYCGLLDGVTFSGLHPRREHHSLVIIRKTAVHRSIITLSPSHFYTAN